MRSNSEPIGPGSSVNTEEEPLKIVSGVIVSRIAGLLMHVFHSDDGVRGSRDIERMKGASNFAKVMTLLPPDLSSWKPVNAHWSNAPFRVFAGKGNGGFVTDKMWVNLNSPTSGVVRAYGAVKGKEFVAYPMGIVNEVVMSPRKDMEVAVNNPMNGMTTTCLSLKKRTRFTLSGGEGSLLK